jgi:CRP-like cAMP-binding protein
MRNELLFMQGHSVQYVMLIQTGSVKLTQSGPSGDEVILWMSGKREAIGIQTQSSPCHSCSARAMSKCNVLIWDISRMQAILSENPQVPYNINYILSSRIEQLEERFREIATERVATRLALTLLRLGKEVGTPHRAGTQISLSREELAQIIGTTLFTISRTLSKWSDSGLIIAEREAVIVPDARRLELASENIEATRAGQVRDTMGKSTRSLLRSSEL